MKCASPYIRDKNGLVKSALNHGYDYLNGVPFPCGQCLACRINKRRVWTSRILLELNHHSKASFVTLTYSPENLPENGSLVKSDLQKFFKRMRKAHYAFRYYAVGEYGDTTFRPHYHLALFGLGKEDLPIIEKHWALGLCHSGDLTPDSAQYVAGYILKKMTKKSDARLGGRAPEFSLSSRRPALGLTSVDNIAASLVKNPHIMDAMRDSQTVPISISQHGKKYPLGRYMRDKLYERFDFTSFEKADSNFRKTNFEILVEATTQQKDLRSYCESQGEKTARKINLRPSKRRNLNE